jgi:hypothetical protein
VSGTSTIQQIFWQPSYNLFILLGTTNAAPWQCISTSPDGITWTTRYAYGASLTPRYYAHNNSTTTIVGCTLAANTGLYSTNGTTWGTVDINGGSTYNAPIVWLPTAGRFQALGSATYSQTPAAIATAWNTAPSTYYRTFTGNTLVTQSNQMYAPEYDSTRGVWYMLGMSVPNPSTQGASGLVTISDTTSARYYFDASNNYYVNKINSIELLPIASMGSTGTTVVALSYVNSTLFIVNQLNSQYQIIYSDVA